MPRLVPAEWEDHKQVWLGFPSHANLWQDNLGPAQEEVFAFVRVLIEKGQENVCLMVCGQEALTLAKTRLSDLPRLTIISGQFGDIWFRDTGPIFVATPEGLSAVKFDFNGWGGKYCLDGDNSVAEQIAKTSDISLKQEDFVLEGGALDHDGFGTCLTTRQCLLNPNRNPGWNEDIAAKTLEKALGIRKILWLEEGLLNDHTDGHVDNLARFISPGLVACPVALDPQDPNARLYDDVAHQLTFMKDSRDVAIQVIRIPSPGPIFDQEGEIIPASHMNFFIAQNAVIIPTYETKFAPLALDALQNLFPEKHVIGLSSKGLISGGGSFHCITQQVPAL